MTFLNIQKIFVSRDRRGEKKATKSNIAFLSFFVALVRKNTRDVFLRRFFSSALFFVVVSFPPREGKLTEG